MQSVTCTDVTVATGITPATALQHRRYVDNPKIDYLVRSHADSQFNSIHLSLSPLSMRHSLQVHRTWLCENIDLLDDWDLAKTKDIILHARPPAKADETPLLLDWRHLIGRDIAPKPVGTRNSSLVEKAGLGECPQEKGIPRRIELRQETQYKTICRSLPKPWFHDLYYIACAVTSNTSPRNIGKRCRLESRSRVSPYERVVGWSVL
jgi:hypothetical protein